MGGVKPPQNQQVVRIHVYYIVLVIVSACLVKYHNRTLSALNFQKIYFYT